MRGLILVGALVGPLMTSCGESSSTSDEDSKLKDTVSDASASGTSTADDAGSGDAATFSCEAAAGNWKTDDDQVYVTILEDCSVPNVCNLMYGQHYEGTMNADWIVLNRPGTTPFHVNYDVDGYTMTFYGLGEDGDLLLYRMDEGQELPESCPPP